MTNTWAGYSGANKKIVENVAHANNGCSLHTVAGCRRLASCKLRWYTVMPVVVALLSHNQNDVRVSNKCCLKFIGIATTECQRQLAERRMRRMHFASWANVVFVFRFLLPRRHLAIYVFVCLCVCEVGSRQTGIYEKSQPKSIRFVSYWFDYANS